jgi:ribosomal protein S18 acetylase RimI-like enzyme
MTERESEVVAEALARESPESAVFVAEDAGGRRLGFIHLVTAADYFTLENHGHVSALAVAPEGEGCGVGRALMLAGEGWARSRGYAVLSLNVFSVNRRARRFYELLGYEEDTLKYVKELG